MRAPFLLVLAALAAVLAAGCVASTPSAPDGTETGATSPERVMPGGGEPLALRVGQAATREGHTIRFVEVATDSRCPAGAACVWAGEARVVLTIDGSAVTLFVPHESPHGDRATSVEIGRVGVEVVGLDPYPGSPEAEAGGPVVVRLVTRSAST